MASALAIFEQIGSPYRESALRNLRWIRGQIEETLFETLFKEAYADPERVVREILKERMLRIGASPRRASDLPEQDSSIPTP